MQKTIDGKYSLKLFLCDYCKRTGTKEGYTIPLSIELLGCNVPINFSYAGTFNNVWTSENLVHISEHDGKDVCLKCYENALKLGLETYQP